MKFFDSISIGIDIVHIERISKNINNANNRFINRNFTENEIKYCTNKKNHVYHFAGKLAAKEAVSKALDLTWNKGINWKDIEIINGKKNIPKVLLHGEAKKVADNRKIRYIQISISHEKEYAVACALIVGE